MSYDLHIVRTKNWIDAANDPITEKDVKEVITEDPELEWSTEDYIDMSDDNGAVTRYYAIKWHGESCFWWYRDQIQCSNPNHAQQWKLVQIARALDAFAIGDDGERYELKKNIFGKDKLIVVDSNEKLFTHR